MWTSFTPYVGGGKNKGSKIGEGDLQAKNSTTFFFSPLIKIQSFDAEVILLVDSYARLKSSRCHTSSLENLELCEPHWGCTRLLKIQWSYKDASL